MKKYLLVSALIGLLFASCKQKRHELTIAVPENHIHYLTAAQDLQSLFGEDDVFKINIRIAANTVEAGKLVANGEADLMFLMNQSEYVSNRVGPQSKKLRVFLPLFDRILFIFYRSKREDDSFENIMNGHKIYLDVPDSEGETAKHFNDLLTLAEIRDYEFVPDTSKADVIHFWGSYYGPRSEYLRQHNWKLFSFSTDMIYFLTLSQPRLEDFYLPPFLGKSNERAVSTLKATAMLVGSSAMNESLVYALNEHIYQHKSMLVSKDRTYNALQEDFRKEALLFPMHKGAERYLNRNEPGFWERHGDTVAKTVSISAILIGAFQSIRANIMRRRKERINSYFADLMEIKNSMLETEVYHQRLEELHLRVLRCMVDGKLDKNDFHIFSRLIQTEIYK